MSEQEFIVDLTHVLQEGMIGHPLHGRTPVRLSGTLSHEGYRDTPRNNPYDGGPLSFANEQWVINGNTGTHMDSGWHADPESPYTAERMPLSCGLGPAVWLDCSRADAAAPEVTAEGLIEAETRAGVRIGRGDIVLIHTGWAAVADRDPKRYLTEHPGLTQDAADWLRNRGIQTLGIDGPTVETITGAWSSPVHTNFLKPRALGLPADGIIAIIENLRNIDQIPSHRFQFIGLPLPLLRGSGSPIRAVAVPL